MNINSQTVFKRGYRNYQKVVKLKYDDIKHEKNYIQYNHKQNCIMSKLDNSASIAFY